LPPDVRDEAPKHYKAKYGRIAAFRLKDMIEALMNV